MKYSPRTNCINMLIETESKVETEILVGLLSKTQKACPSHSRVISSVTNTTLFLKVITYLNYPIIGISMAEALPLYINFVAIK